MTVLKEKKYQNSDGIERRIQIGKSTWNEEELSVRYYYEDNRGRMCFKSPEVPLDVAIFMVKLMKEDIDVLPRETIDMLAKM